MLRTLRGYFIDIAGSRIDRRVVGSAIFERMLGMKLGDRSGSSGAFAGLLREFEALRDFFASATLSAVVDVPFILLFGVVIWAIGGWLVMVPLVLIPLVILVGLATQPLLARLAVQGLNQGMSKQGVLVEAISGLETIKSSSAGPLLARRWASAVDDHAASVAAPAPRRGHRHQRRGVGPSRSPMSPTVVAGGRDDRAPVAERWAG